MSRIIKCECMSLCCPWLGDWGETGVRAGVRAWFLYMCYELNDAMSLVYVCG
jgi:hypothetical protein